MIIDNLDIVRVAAAPFKTDTPLAIDPDAVLAFPAAFERLEAVAGRNDQIIQADSSVQNTQLRQSALLNVGRQLPGKFAIPNFIRFAVAKACNHMNKSLMEMNMFVNGI